MTSQRSKIIVEIVKTAIFTVTSSGEIFHGEKPIKLQVHKGPTDYYVFTHRVNKKKSNIPVHRLQAYLKFGKKALRPRVEIRHLDGNSFNNSWDNLELGTRKQNERDKPLELRMRVSKIALAAKRLKRLQQEVCVVTC